MESGDGVEVELNKAETDDAPESNGFFSIINKENEIVENGAEAVNVSSGHEGTSKVDVIDSSGDREEAPASAPKIKATNPSIPSKKGGSHGSSSQFRKTPKKSDLLNGSTPVEPQKRMHILSQSLSFPSKGPCKSAATSTRQPKVASSITNGDLAPKATASTSPKTTTVNSGLVEAAMNDASAKDAPLNDSNPKLLTNRLPAKNDDDAHSNASSSTPRARKSAASGFSFRLDERAEKRKEFFMKLEEKNHAKELEKTNLQAKSKENQEAEIKQLRKNLTFKATPMPSFYQEPGPPKVELKKIPPTRARSPKLGRRKQSVTATDNPASAVNSCETRPLESSSTKTNEGGAASNTGDASASKNRKQKSLVKLPSQKSKPGNSAVKSITGDKNATKPKAKSGKVEVEKSDDQLTEAAAAAAEAEDSDRLEEDTTRNTDIPGPETTAQEVAAQG